MTSNAAESHETSTDSRTFSWGRVIGLIVALAIVAGLTFGGYSLLSNQKPSLYPVSGVATIDGEPLPEGAFIRTKHLGGQSFAIGPITADGKFELMTELKPGAYAGTHKVMVEWVTNTFPVHNYLPAEYSDPNQTPFTEEVSIESQNTPWKLELKGKIEAPAGGPPQMPPRGPQGGEADQSEIERPELESSESTE